MPVGAPLSITLGLEDLWRYAMAGTALVLVVAFALGSPDALVAISSVASLVMGAVAALILGSLIYGVYRSLLQRVTFRIDLRRAIRLACPDGREQEDLLKKMEGRLFGGYSELEWDLMMARWEGRKAGRVPWAELRAWASMIQLLYCTALAILLALLIAFVVARSRGVPVDLLPAGIAAASALVLLLAAHGSGARYLEVELRSFLKQRSAQAIPEGGL